MRNLTKLYLVIFSLSIIFGLEDCQKKDDTVLITYQHLANFQSWELNGKHGVDATAMWHVYMLRGIVNTGKDAKPFAFDLRKFVVEGGASETVNSSSPAMLAALPYTLPLNFTTTVQPKQAFTVTTSAGVLFFIKQNNDTEKTSVTNLLYKKSNGESLSLLIVMLNQSAEPMYGHLDQAFLEQIHAKQQEYEDTYDPAGKRH